MNITVAWPNAAQWKAVGRQAVQFGAGAVAGSAALLTFAVTFHFISTDQSSQITGALTNISTGIQAVVTGVGNIATGVAALVGVASAVWSAYAASKRGQAASLEKQGAVVITDPATAAAVPSPNVASVEHPAEIVLPNATIHVVPK